jgi:peptidoglycan/LPS O-acetylase OafA/YrhL
MVVASLFLRWRDLKIVNSLPGWLWTVFELGALAGALGFAWSTPWLYRNLFARQTLSAFAMYANTSGSFPAFGVLIGVLAFEKGLISRLLSAGWLVLLGEISYSIYLIHQILIRWYDLHRATLAVIPRDARYLIFWLAVLVASLILWFTVEKPSQRGIKSRLRISEGLHSTLQKPSQTSAPASASSTSSVDPAGGS